MPPLFFSVLVLLTCLRIRSTGKLWNKPLSRAELTAVRDLSVYPFLVSLVASLIGLVIVAPGEVTDSAAILAIVLLGVVPAICLIVPAVGILRIYFASQRQRLAVVGERTGLALSLQKAARYLKVSEADLLRLTLDGTIKARLVDGQYTYNPEVLAIFRSMMPEQGTGMNAQQSMTVRELLHRIETSWNTFYAYLDTLSEAQFIRPKDAAGWTVKDHLIHIAAWEDTLNAILERTPRWERLGVDKALWDTGDVARLLPLMGDTFETYEEHIRRIRAIFGGAS